MIDWERARRPDGSLDLVSAFELRYGPSNKTARMYLREVEGLRPQLSRQSASVAVVTAHWFALSLPSD